MWRHDVYIYELFFEDEEKRRYEEVELFFEDEEKRRYEEEKYPTKKRFFFKFVFVTVKKILFIKSNLALFFLSSTQSVGI
jgi:hypothetical protein